MHAYFKTCISYIFACNSRINYDDILALAPLEEEQLLYRIQAQDALQSLQGAGGNKAEGRGILIQVAESAYRFLLGAMAGGKEDTRDGC